MTATVVREALYRTGPDCRTSYGDLARQVACNIGMPPDDEQQAALDAIFAEKDPGIPAARSVAILGARQNIKTSTLEIAALTDLLVFELPGVWTAHETKTSTKTHQEMRKHLKRCAEYDAIVDFRSGRGEEKVILRGTDLMLEFYARSNGSGRGFSTDRLTLDEALFLQPGDVAALLPTMLTRAGAQVRYGSSGGFKNSAVLRDLRRRGEAGTDERLFYVEYGAERRDCQSPSCTHVYGDAEGCALDDRELWWQANSALWCGRIREENVEELRKSMPPEMFARECLTWHDDPPEGGEGVFSGKWLALADPEAERGKALAFGIAVAPDRSWSAIAVAWHRPDGERQVMLADYKPSTDWLPARVAELKARWGGTVTASTTARGLVPDAVEPGQGEQALAHTAMDDAVMAGKVHHGNENALNTAVRGARWKPYGDTRMFDRKGSTDISPLDAAALALHGLKTTTTSGGWVLSV